MFFLLILLGIATAFYAWMKWNYTFWKRNKVPGPEPQLFFGNIGGAIKMSEHMGLVATNWYNDYPNEPYAGYYKLLRPSIIVRDPELLKDILVTNFDSFRKNDIAVSTRHDELIAMNPFCKFDDDWSEARRAISPIFSHVKLKSAMTAINSVGAELVEYIKSADSNADFAANDLSLRFTTQNVIKCLFSIDARCFDRSVKDNEFLNVINQLFSPSKLVAIKHISAFLMPQWFIEHLPISMLSPIMDRWFRLLVRTNKESRTKDSQSNDFFQTLLQIQGKNGYDEARLAGQAMAFYTEGTETSSIVLSYTLFELAQHPEYQQRLHDEVTTILSKHNGQVTYESLQEMQYMEWIIHESIRVHPPAFSMAKICTKPYTLPKTTGQTEPITIAPGTVALIPIFGLFMDPKYFPNPDEFRPERFSDEEISKRPKHAYIGFGDGARACIGQRFALIQMKTALVHIIMNFHVKPSPDQKPIVIDPKTFMSYPKDGIFVRFEQR